MTGFQVPYKKHPINQESTYLVGDENSGILEIPRVGSLKQSEAEAWAEYLNSTDLGSTLSINLRRWVATLMLNRCEWFRKLPAASDSQASQRSVLDELPEALVDAIYSFFNRECDHWKEAPQPEEIKTEPEEEGKP